MTPTDTRPSDIYLQTHRRLVARERDRILAMHRANFAAHQFAAEIERHQDKEFYS
jgi:hypothetical protein